MQQGAFDIPTLRMQLAQHGAMHATDKDGRKLFVVLSRQLAMQETGILLAYEGEGAYFFTLDRPLNRFRLVQGGFSYIVAGWLSDLLNQIVGIGGELQPTQPHTALTYTGPKP